MAMRCIVCRSTVRNIRYFSDGKGRIFGEEERAAENVYIKKMEKERAEMAKLKAEREKAETEKSGKKASRGAQQELNDLLRPMKMKLLS